MIIKWISCLLIGFSWGRMSLDDYGFRAVRPLDVLIVCVLLILWSAAPFTQIFLVFLVIVGVMLLQMMAGKTWLSFADAFIFGASCLWIRDDLFPIFFIMLGITLALYHVITKEERAPFLTIHLFVFVFMMVAQYGDLWSLHLKILP